MPTRITRDLACTLAVSLLAGVALADATLPEGTEVKASFPTADDKKPENLFDGDPNTVMIGAPNTAKAGKPVWVDLVFPEPVADLAGLELGNSDKFRNYYPKKMEFWGDSDGNGTFDTLLGSTDKLGPASDSVGKRMFDGRLPALHGLRIRVTEQNVAGVGRAFQMDEIKLIRDAAAPVIPATPDRKSDDVAPEVPAKPQAAKGAPQPVAADASIVPGADKLPGTILPLPAGTKIEASFRTEKDKGPDKLFDNDLATGMVPGGGTLSGPDAVVSIVLRFPEPLENLGGVETGATDIYKNYYPRQIQFWADSDGDGRIDTKLGASEKFGPGDESIGRHAFAGRLPQVHALEIRGTQSKFGGGKRVWPMTEMRLVADPALPIVPATPNSWRTLTYESKIPEGTTVKVNFECESGKGPELLLDGNEKSFMMPKQGTADVKPQPSVFLRFPGPQRDLAGIELGRSDPYKNYVWQTMQVFADGDNDGTYETLVATLSGGGEGVKRFSRRLPETFGLELRVTEQKTAGAKRAFILGEIAALVFVDDPGDQQMRLVVEDFEDFSSWRTWANNTNQPEGERYYGGYTYLCGVYDPEKAHVGQGVGKMRYCFKPGAKGYTMWATRGRVSEAGGIVDAITFSANPQGYPSQISFELTDAYGKKIRTPGVDLKDGWNSYTVDLSGKAFPEMATAAFPVKLKHIFLSSKQAGEGDVLLDDITLVGVFDRTQRLSIKPRFAGMTYDPAKPLAPEYVVRNMTAAPLETTLDATLYSSFDPRRKHPLKQLKLPLKVESFGRATVAVDFGAMPYGHYEVELGVQTDAIAVATTDPLAVATLNGGRVNKSGMYFGSQHPASWIADPENEFVFKNVVVPLGLDCYRTGAPNQKSHLLDTDLLLAAGFGSMPPELRLPTQPKDDRGEPNDYDAYYEWCKKMAREKYLPYADRILAIEYYNEPDLPDFCYLPDIDTYLKMHRIWAKAFREVIPGVKIGTGGNTVQHGKEKPDFNRRMYTELAKEADVAIWHAHGPLENYASRQRLVEKWTEQGGRPLDQQLLANTEAGATSGQSAIGRLNQAEILVKKIGWAKSQPNSYYYNWFTTTDTYDPQGGYLANENWGLITYNQRLKPSGQAYNELIRMLANTKGLGETKLDERLQACAFVRDDGTQVWLAWPTETGTPTLVRLSASAPVTLVDMFGLRKPLTPVGGLVTFESNGYPLYLEAPKDAKIAPAGLPEFVRYDRVIGVPPGKTLTLPVSLKNTFGADATLDLTLVGPADKPLASTSIDLTAGQQATATLTYDLPADAPYGSSGCVLRIRGRGDQPVVEESFPFSLVIAQMVVATSGFQIDGKPDAVANAASIKLDQSTDLRDLVSDPSTPNWAGPQDLSATATFAHDRKGVYVCIDVRDQTHNPGPSGAKLWTGDSVQIAFYAGSKHTEVGLTESDAGTGWAWIAADASNVGKKLDLPIAVRRDGDHTIYEAYFPYEFLGVDYKPMFPLRLTFLVNEDDGRGRVRLLKWFDGIAAGKDADLFGHLVLE